MVEGQKLSSGKTAPPALQTEPVHGKPFPDAKHANPLCLKAFPEGIPAEGIEILIDYPTIRKTNFTTETRHGFLIIPYRPGFIREGGIGKEYCRR
jgi:hypothetical protein